jgi:hypothetical protein
MECPNCRFENREWAKGSLSCILVFPKYDRKHLIIIHTNFIS